MTTNIYSIIKKYKTPLEAIEKSQFGATIIWDEVEELYAEINLLGVVNSGKKEGKEQ